MLIVVSSVLPAVRRPGCNRTGRFGVILDKTEGGRMVQSRTRLAFAVAVVLAASVACTNNVQGTGSGARSKPSQKVAHPVTPSMTPSPTPSAAGQRDGLSVTAVRAYPRLSPARDTHTARLLRCRSAQIGARVARSGSEASQPFVTIALRNRSATACALRGYPGVSAFGHRPGAPVTKLAIHVRRGPIYERRDPGPHQVPLMQGATSSFNIGTATAYGPPLITLTRLLIRPPGETATIPVHVQMYATRSRGRPIPLGVTAVRLGIPSMTSATKVQRAKTPQ